MVLTTVDYSELEMRVVRHLGQSGGLASGPGRLIKDLMDLGFYRCVGLPGHPVFADVMCRQGNVTVAFNSAGGGYGVPKFKHELGGRDLADMVGDGGAPVASADFKVRGRSSVRRGRREGPSSLRFRTDSGAVVEMAVNPADLTEFLEEAARTALLAEAAEVLES